MKIVAARLIKRDGCKLIETDELSAMGILFQVEKDGADIYVCRIRGPFLVVEPCGTEWRILPTISPDEETIRFLLECWSSALEVFFKPPHKWALTRALSGE